MKWKLKNPRSYFLQIIEVPLNFQKQFEVSSDFTQVIIQLFQIIFLLHTAIWGYKADIKNSKLAYHLTHRSKHLKDIRHQQTVQPTGSVGSEYMGWHYQCGAGWSRQIKRWRQEKGFFIWPLERRICFSQVALFQT